MTWVIPTSFFISKKMFNLYENMPWRITSTFKYALKHKILYTMWHWKRYKTIKIANKNHIISWACRRYYSIRQSIDYQYQSVHVRVVLTESNDRLFRILQVPRKERGSIIILLQIKLQESSGIYNFAPDIFIIASLVLLNLRWIGMHHNFIPTKSR